MLGYLGDHHGQTIPKDVAVLFEAHTAKTRIDEEQIELAHIEMSRPWSDQVSFSGQ